MAQAARARHTAATVAAADEVWEPAERVCAGTVMQHETDTTAYGDAATGSWKAAYTAHCQDPWPSNCSFCTLWGATVAAHVSNVQMKGIFLVPCCTACNRNVCKGVKRQVLLRDVWAVPLPAREVTRVMLAQIKPEEAFSCAYIDGANSTKCTNTVCAKTDCQGSSRKFCCQHCSCRKAGVKCSERVVQHMLTTPGLSVDSAGTPMRVAEPNAKSNGPVAVEVPARKSDVALEVRTKQLVAREDREETKAPAVMVMENKTLEAPLVKAVPATVATSKVGPISDGWVCVDCELANPAKQASCTACSRPRTELQEPSTSLTDTERLLRFVVGLDSFISYDFTVAKEDGKAVTRIIVKLNM
jgi:hypothetical protein